MTLWKDYRNFTNKVVYMKYQNLLSLQKSFLLNFLNSKEILRGYSFLPLTTLLKYWNENVAGTTSAVVSKFGQQYLYLHSSAVDRLCKWVCDTMEMIQENKGSIKHCSEKTAEKSKQDSCTNSSNQRNEMAFQLARLIQERIREKKQESCGEQTASLDVVTEGGIDDIGNDRNDYSWWIKELDLFTADLMILQSTNAWLNASIVDSSQRILAQQFHCQHGLQSVGCGLAMSFSVTKQEYVQILHDHSRNHWLTISNKGAQDGEIYVYDSLLEVVERGNRFGIVGKDKRFRSP